jgi:hypothetical protein
MVAAAAARIALRLPAGDGDKATGAARFLPLILPMGEARVHSAAWGLCRGLPLASARDTPLSHRSSPERSGQPRAYSDSAFGKPRMCHMHTCTCTFTMHVPHATCTRQTIAWRQAANASHWGSSMLEWAPRNLQSSLLLTPYHATFAEHLGTRAPHTAEGSAKRACFSAFDDSARPHHTGRFDVGRPVGAARVALLRRVLRGFDLVGLLERFDETLLLLADLTGLQRLLAPRRRPLPTGPHDLQPPSAEQICPDRGVCAAAIAARAPVDAMMYAEVSRAFGATVAAQGVGFGRRLVRLRRARRAWRAERRHERTRRGYAHALVVPRARQVARPK